MEAPLSQPQRGDITLKADEAISITAEDLVIKSPEGSIFATEFYAASRAAHGAEKAAR
jgi:hypothetical protein